MGGEKKHTIALQLTIDEWDNLTVELPDDQAERVKRYLKKRTGKWSRQYSYPRGTDGMVQWMTGKDVDGRYGYKVGMFDSVRGFGVVFIEAEVRDIQTMAAAKRAALAHADRLHESGTIKKRR